MIASASDTSPTPSRAASKFVDGRSRNDLDADRMLVFALVRAAYFDVDLDILWNTVTQALPPLGQQIGAALGGFEGDR